MSENPKDLDATNAHVLLSNNILYPVVGFGTFKLKGAACSAAVGHALNNGYLMLETAAVYENEDAIKPFVTEQKKGSGKEAHAPPKVPEAAYRTDLTPGKTAPADMGVRAIDVSGEHVFDSKDGSVRKEYDSIYKFAPFIQTKLWRSAHGRQNGIPKIDESLKKLGLQYKASGNEAKQDKGGAQFRMRRPLDCILIHWPGPKRGWPLANQPDGSPGVNPKDWSGKTTRLATWRTLEDYYLDNRVRFIGICNYSLRQLKEIVENKDTRVKPHVLQIELHPLLAQKELLSYCAEKNILVQAYASLGGSDKVGKDSAKSK